MTLNVGRREKMSTGQSSPYSIPGMTRHERWNLRLGIWQVLSVWLIISGALVSAFFVGLMIGQDHGLKNALQEQSERIVRLPIIPHDGIPQVGNIGAVDSAGPEGQTALPTPSPIIAKPLFEATKKRAEEEPLLAGGQELPPVAGFAAKPAGGELLASVRRDEKASSLAKESKVGSADQKTQISKTENRGDARALLGDMADKKLIENSVVPNNLMPDNSARKSLPAGTVGLTQAEGARADVKKVDVKPAEVKKIEPKPIEKKPATAVAPAPAKVPPATVSPITVASATSPVGKKVESENKVSTGQNVSKGWYIQVAAVESNKEAQALQGRLKGAGVSSYVQDARVKNTRYFRVLAGPYSDRGQGEAALSKIKKASGTKGEPFLKRID